MASLKRRRSYRRTRRSYDKAARRANRTAHLTYGLYTAFTELYTEIPLFRDLMFALGLPTSSPIYHALGLLR